VAADNIFKGMTESPVLIKNYLPTMNRSEIFLVMVSGMGTIAGSVMGTYIGMLGGTDPAAKVLFATHLLYGFRNGSTGFNRFSENALSADGRSHGPCSYLRQGKENSNI